MRCVRAFWVLFFQMALLLLPACRRCRARLRPARVLCCWWMRARASRWGGGAEGCWGGGG